MHSPDRRGFTLALQVGRTVLVPVVHTPGDEFERLVESVESVTVMRSKRRMRCRVEPGYRAKMNTSARGDEKRSRKSLTHGLRSRR